jgi:flagellar biosynthesis protein FlhB
MFNELTNVTTKNLDFFKNLLHNLTLLELLKYFIVAFIITIFLLYGSKLLRYLLKYTIELAEILLKIISILLLILLLLVLISIAWDSNRPCGFKYEKYVTRCQPQR